MRLFVCCVFWFRLLCILLVCFVAFCPLIYFVLIYIKKKKTGQRNPLFLFVSNKSSSYLKKFVFLMVIKYVLKHLKYKWEKGFFFLKFLGLLNMILWGRNKMKLGGLCTLVLVLDSLEGK